MEPCYARRPSVHAIQFAVGAHDRPHIRFLDGDLECQQIRLPQRALVHVGAVNHPAVLLVIDRIAIDIANHELVLRALQRAAEHLAD
jgi:hypothetical protein